MNAPERTSRGFLFVVIAGVLAAGAAGLDLGAPHAGVTVLDRPGAAAAAGAGAAVLAAAFGYALRAVLGRREGGDDVRNRS